MHQLTSSQGRWAVGDVYEAVTSRRAVRGFLHRVLRWSGLVGGSRDVLALEGLHRSLQRIKETTEG